jgi:glycosyltransferase involved in cell wall biosynthesis
MINNSLLLSICIPTFNRSKYLDNCLNSILNNNFNSNNIYEICISDNNSTDNTLQIIEKYRNSLPIVYSRNEYNIGMASNFLKVVSMARGIYVWMLGDDDLLFNNSIERLFELFNKHKNVDFFYLNSSHLDKNYLDKFSHPFDTKYLPNNLEAFSKFSNSTIINFMELINPKISFDFLGGIYLCVFKKNLWNEGLAILNQENVNDLNTFSTFENTFPHIKVFAFAYKNSMAYYSKDCYTINLHGVREWSNYYPLIRCVRLPEALKEYKKNGLPFTKFYMYSNQIAIDFVPNFLYMLKNKNTTGYKYINPLKLIFKNMAYYNFYISVIKYIFYKISKKNTY